jgi:hypothetical protein
MDAQNERPEEESSNSIESVDSSSHFCNIESISKEEFELLLVLISSSVFLALQTIIVIIPYEIVDEYLSKIYRAVILLVLSNIIGIFGIFFIKTYLLWIALVLTMGNIAGKFMYFIQYYSIGVTIALDFINILIYLSIIFQIKSTQSSTNKNQKKLLNQLIFKIFSFS